MHNIAQNKIHPQVTLCNNNMNQRITHEGIIDHIENDAVFVRILSQSACSACHAKGTCSVSEMSEKLVEVRGNKNNDFAVGETVNIILDSRLGNMAVIFGYVVPFLVLLVSLVIASRFLTDLWAGLLAIALLIPYFLLLFVFKDKLGEKFTFKVEKI